MGTAGQRLRLRLFLEGIEVPVISATVQIGINSPATAAIQVVPGDRILDLKARTMVHLFFWDYTLDNEVPPFPKDAQLVAEKYGITIDEANELIADNPEDFGDDDDNDLTGHKLLFSGEVIGVALLKTPGGRQAVLQCADFSTYWDTTYQFFVSYSPNGNFLTVDGHAAVWAGAASMFDDIAAGHVSVMNEYLRSKPKTPGLQNVKGLMGGIISLLEAMGGVPNHTHGVNDFFTIAELKNHILQQIVAEQNDDTAQRLFDNKAFMDWLMRGMTSLGQLTTFRDMMTLLFKYVYYEIVPNPAAMYVPSVATISTKKTLKSKVAVELSPALKGEIQGYYEEASRHFDVAFNRSRGDSTNLIPGRKNDGVIAKSLKNAISNAMETAEMPSQTRAKLALTLTWLNKIKDVPEIKDGQTIPANQSDPTRTLLVNIKAWYKVREILGDILKKEMFAQVSRTITKTKPGELDRLHSQIFRPDCFFAAPPRCNVIFPDQYTQFQFSRNFLQETTRLRLSVDWLFGGGAHGLLAEYHFAPAVSQLRAIAKKQGNYGIRALLPWEKYSGILPKFETIHEINYVAGRSERRMGIKGNIKGAATNYAARTANFNYMKYRFASRTCEVTTKFNPFLVCGFPAVIIERPFIVEPEKLSEIRQRAQALNPTLDINDMSEFVRFIARVEGAPSQYLGMIAAMSHSVSQEGGATSIVLTHARTHRVTSDDFLGIFSEQLTTEVDSEIVSTVLDAEELIRRGDYRLLKFLLDSTPQNLDVQSQSARDSQLEIEDTDDSPPIENRPMFGGLLASPKAAPVRLFVPSSKSVNNSTNIPIRGEVIKDRLINSRQVILVPKEYGKLKIGSRGPKNGKIVQIQCVSDAAIGIIGKDVSKRLQTGKSVTVTSNRSDEFVKDPQTGKLTIRGNVVNSSDVTYLWKKIVIFEEKKTRKRTSQLLPVEEGLRPPWFSPLYSNWFIGDNIYQPFFGTGSIVDQALFVSDQGVATFGTGRAQQQKLLDDLKAADNDRAKMLKLLEEAKAKKIADIPDIESSVDVLAYIYGEVRRLGLDVHRFINDYTKRPIATMEDMFGSADLEYAVEGNKLKIVKGTPGFHSAAIAKYGNLLGLLDNPDMQLPRLRSGAGGKAPISKELDPRPGRRAQVELYLEEINAASGSLGVGVIG